MGNIWKSCLNDELIQESNLRKHFESKKKDDNNNKK